MPQKKLNKKLDRLNSLLGCQDMTGSQDQIGLEKKPSKKNKLPSRYQKMADECGGELISRDEGSYVLIKKLYPFDYLHGDYPLKSSKKPKRALEAFIVKPDKTELLSDKLFFFDTETTGLGGSGAVAFLIGCGSMTKEGLEVRQYLLPDYDDETAMLEDFQNEFSPDIIPVSYNGAAFDMPLVLDRMIINRVGRKLDYLTHVDLLHTVRRLFKRRLKDCRLVNIEEELLNFYRTDDIPGYLVPSIYFEWLSNESLYLMEGVLEHNRLDIVSLYFLYHLIGDLYENEGEQWGHIDDLHSLSKLFGRRKELEKTALIFNKINNLENQPMADDIKYYHGINFKRSGDWTQALALFEQIKENSGRESFLANIELAKYYEHKKGDLKRALNHSETALKICPDKISFQKQITGRINRLQLKITKISS